VNLSQAPRLVLCLGALAFSHCSRTTPSQGPALLGDMKPVVSVKELMEDMIDPASDSVFDAVGTDVNARGAIVEVAPKTDEEWAKVRSGDVNVSTGPNPPELSPTQIKAKISCLPPAAISIRRARAAISSTGTRARTSGVSRGDKRRSVRRAANRLQV